MTRKSQCLKPEKTQGQKLVSILKRRWMTYGDMEDLKVSTCPWKRVKDAIPEGHALSKRTNANGLIEWRIVRKREEEVAA